MATTNTFLILSEPLFDAHPSEGRKKAQNVLSAPDVLTGNVDRYKYGGKISSGQYGTAAQNLPGAIEVLDFGFTIQQIGSEEGGRPRSVEDIKRSEFTFTKAVDSRSPKLFKFCCEGTYIGAAELQVFGPVPDRPYLTYRMTYVHISTYQPSGSDTVPTEQIGLRYGQMAVKFDEAGIGGTENGNPKSGSIVNRFSWVMQAPIEFPGGLPGLMEGSAFKMK